MAKKRYTGEEIINAQPLYFSEKCRKDRKVSAFTVVPTLHKGSFIVEKRNTGILSLEIEYVVTQVNGLTKFGNPVIFNDKSEVEKYTTARGITL